MQNFSMTTAKNDSFSLMVRAYFCIKLLIKRKKSDLQKISAYFCLIMNELKP